MARQTATIYDVASAAGVSIATVSRVLNGSAGVRPETRARVDAAIKQLQFVPSAAARTLSSGRRGSIGLAYPLDEARSAAAPSREEDNAVLYADAIIRGASWQASQRGYSLFSCAVRIGHEAQSHALQQLYSAVDGIILTDRVVNDVRSMRIAKRMHAVHLSGSGTSTFGGTIRIDNAGGISKMVEHLATAHRITDFGFVGGIAESPDASARLDAFTQSVNAVGGTLHPVNILQGDFSLAKAAGATAERMNRVEALPQVFACANDQMALGVIQALREGGVEVPRRVAVTGFDDLPIAEFVQPGLTTVAQPSFELGAAAVEMVLGLLDGAVPIGTVQTLPADLVVRQSCGCGAPSAKSRR